MSKRNCISCKHALSVDDAHKQGKSSVSTEAYNNSGMPGSVFCEKEKTLKHWVDSCRKWQSWDGKGSADDRFGAPPPPVEKSRMEKSKPPTVNEVRESDIRIVLGFSAFGALVAGLMVLFKDVQTGTAILVGSAVLWVAAVAAKYLRMFTDIMLTGSLFYLAYKMGLFIYRLFEG